MVLITEVVHPGSLDFSNQRKVVLNRDIHKMTFRQASSKRLWQEAHCPYRCEHLPRFQQEMWSPQVPLPELRVIEQCRNQKGTVVVLVANLLLLWAL